MRMEENSGPFPGFMFPLAGKAEFSFSGTSYLLTQGSVLHGAAEMNLVRRVVGNEKWKYMLVLYRISNTQPDELSLSNTHFQLPITQSPRLTDLLERLWAAHNEPGGIYAFRTETLFRCVLDEIFISIRNQTNNGAQSLFEQATAYMHEHYMESITVSALAKQYDVNENRLSYAFHKYAGIGPGDYLITYRINRAKEMLLDLEAPVYVVAKCVGYADPYYFSRIFKRQTGLSPTEFREKFRNNAW